MVAAMVAASSAPPPPTDTAVLDEVMEALTMTIANTTTTASVAAAASNSIGPCCHGSTSAHFLDGRAYSDVMKKLLAVSDDTKKVDKFYRDHHEDNRDSNFVQYIFAVCTSLYLKTNTTNDEMGQLLLMATSCKYIFSDPDEDKMNRYARTFMIMDERGIINCLSRETKSFCDCMQPKKMEAKGMAKTELCDGCNHSFPRKGMLKCGGCNLAMYCNEDCQTKDWPKHKEYCKNWKQYVPSGKHKTRSTVTRSTTTILVEEDNTDDAKQQQQQLIVVPEDDHEQDTPVTATTTTPKVVATDTHQAAAFCWVLCVALLGIVLYGLGLE